MSLNERSIAAYLAGDLAGVIAAQQPLIDCLEGMMGPMPAQTGEGPMWDETIDTDAPTVDSRRG